MTSSSSIASSAASSTLTSLGPLTTTFAPASSCTVDLYRYNYNGLTCIDESSSTVACQFYHLGVDTSTSACMPSGWNDNVGAHYSPGVCPSGYTEACSSSAGSGSAEETRAICCPSGYACQTYINLPWYTTDLCVSQMTSSEIFVFTTSIIGEGSVKSTKTGEEGLNAFGISIRYKATDFVSSTATSTSSSTIITGTTSSTSAAATSSSSSSSNNINSSSNGLSSGAKAGIGIGVALGAVAIITALVFFFLRRQRHRGTAATDVQLDHPPAYPYAYAQPPEQKYMQTQQAPLVEAPTYGQWDHHSTELAELSAAR